MIDSGSILQSVTTLLISLRYAALAVRNSCSLRDVPFSLMPYIWHIPSFLGLNMTKWLLLEYGRHSHRQVYSALTIPLAVAIAILAFTRVPAFLRTLTYSCTSPWSSPKARGLPLFVFSYPISWFKACPHWALELNPHSTRIDGVHTANEKNQTELNVHWANSHLEVQWKWIGMECSWTWPSSHVA